MRISFEKVFPYFIYSLIVVFFFILAVFINAEINKIFFQGNHDITEVQGNHDTLVKVKEELCDYSIRKVLGMDWEGAEPNVKVHHISGETGEIVADVIILYKQFPVTIQITEEESGKYESDNFRGSKEDGKGSRK